MIILLGLPVLGILLGGIYSLPAMSLTKERDPWLTILLALGLTITVFGIGLPTQMPLSYLFALWFVSIALLLIRRAAGHLGHNIERFGMVHMATLLLTLIVVMLVHIKHKHVS